MLASPTDITLNNSVRHDGLPLPQNEAPRMVEALNLSVDTPPSSSMTKFVPLGVVAAVPPPLTP